MSVKVSVKELQDQLPELLDQIAENGKEYVIERNGKECAVIVNARQWRRRKAAERVDALGDRFRLSVAKQSRLEQLLTTQRERKLTPAEARNLKSLLRESDEIMLRRADAMERLS